MERVRSLTVLAFVSVLAMPLACGTTGGGNAGGTTCGEKDPDAGGICGEASGDDAATAPMDGGSGLAVGDAISPANDAGTDARLPDGDGAANAIGPLDLRSATIYSVYPSIYSAAGTLAAVTADLGRIHDLGFNVLYLLPVTPIGQATGSHPSYGSPYCVHDYYAIDPALGTSSDLVALVSAAHALGMHVLLDEVLNHTAWDNALITAHPEYYLHSDGNPTNVSSIEEAFTYADVAQLDYKTPTNGLAQYVTAMLEYWITTYDVDGFRFDTADSPYGDGRMIPSSFWVPLRAALESAKSGFVMLGEEEDPELALAPFDLDYNWHLQGLYGDGGLQQVATGGNAGLLEEEWEFHQQGWPAGMLHMTLLQDWDLGEDLTLYGGVPNTLAAAAFNFTIDGVPLLFDGEEVGNDQSGVNTHAAIDWSSPNAARFTAFYKSLIALRNRATALQQGTVTWVTNSASTQIASFARSDASGTFLVVVNFSNGLVTGTVDAPTATAWADVSPAGSPGGTAHAAPPALSLAAYDFAVYEAK